MSKPHRPTEPSPPLDVHAAARAELAHDLAILIRRQMRRASSPAASSDGPAAKRGISETKTHKEK